MFKSAFAYTTMFMVLLSVGGEYARAQKKSPISTKPSDAEILGVQEVGLPAWQPKAQQLPEPEEINVQVPRQVELTPGPNKPGDIPENEDHRGIQVKVINPDLE